MSDWLLLILDSCIKGTIVVIITLTLCKFAKKLSAEIKYLAMLTSFISLLLLPIIANFLYYFKILLFKATAQWVTPAYGLISGESVKTSIFKKLKITENSVPKLDLARYLFILWALGAAVVIIGMLIGIIGSVLMVKKFDKIEQFKSLEVLEELKARLNIKKSIHLRVAKRIYSPITVGYYKPTIILPEEALNWSQERLVLVFTHELSHIKRKDNLIQVILKMICAIYWFNPLIWVIYRKIHIQRELCCDNRVLNIGIKPYIYADNLVEMARGFKKRPAFASAVSSFGGASAIEARVMNILDNKTRKRKNKLGVTIGTIMILCSAIMPLSILNITLKDNFSIPSFQPFSLSSENSMFIAGTEGGKGINIYKTGDCAAVMADGEGVVSEVGGSESRCYIVIQHPYGFQSRYGNIVEPMVKVGDSVTKETAIGFSAAGDGLYYEVKLNSMYLRPDRLNKE